MDFVVNQQNYDIPLVVYKVFKLEKFQPLPRVEFVSNIDTERDLNTCVFLNEGLGTIIK